MKETALTCLLSAAALLSGTMLFSRAAAKAPEFDHYAIHVRDLAKSGDFYEKVIGLEKIPEPFKDGRHIWFRVGPHGQLHIIAGAVDLSQQAIDIHFALRVASLADFKARLDKMQIKYRSFKGDNKFTPRPDGVNQLYLQDPDGYWIEVNDSSY